MNQKTGCIDRFFQVSQNHSSVRTEVLAGITTFITIAYILILNPQILADPYVIMGDAAMAGKIANGVFIGTCIGAFIGTILCALYARVPFAQAPGMGLNAFFAYTVVLGMGYTYGQALVVVFISGVFFIVITAIGLREAIIRSIPDAVKTAITPGIGLFITIIGLKNAGIVISNPATLVSLVDFSQWKIEGADLALMSSALVALAGLVIMGMLHARKVKGSILFGHCGCHTHWNTSWSDSYFKPGYEHRNEIQGFCRGIIYENGLCRIIFRIQYGGDHLYCNHAGHQLFAGKYV